MAIKWGDYVTIGGVRYRTGLDVTYSPTTITSSTASVTVTTRVYLGIPSTYQASGSNLSWSVTGSDSGSGDGLSWLISTGAGQRLISTLTETVSLSYGATKSFSVTGRIRPIFSAGTWTPNVTASITVPARPISAPAALTAASATRSSDTRQNVAWTRNATTAAPYTNILVERWDNVSGAYALIATLSGTATSYADTSTRSDRRYRYRVKARNSAGTSPVAYTDYISTTPATPAAPTARKSGTGIVVTRPSLSSPATGWRVWRSSDGAAEVLVSGSTPVALVSTSWTDPAPSAAQTHRYRIEAVSTGPVLYSAKSPWSGTVQLEAPPNAPSRLAPTAAHDAAFVIPLSWQHNPVDTTDQSAYEIEWRIGSAGAVTTTGKVTSGDSTREVLPGTWTNGSTVQWRVRTWGAHADPSPWSTWSNLPLSASPVAGILEPVDGGIVEGSSVLVEWSYFQADGSPYTAWELQVLRGTEPIFSRTSSGTTSYRTGSILEDGGAYTARIRVRSGAGIWSEWDEIGFTVDYAPPPTPTVTASFDRDAGYTVLSVDVAPAAAGEVPAESIAVHRASPDGWVLIEEGLAPGQTTTDRIPPLGQTVQYRATATSGLPSTASSAPVAVDTRTRWVFFNYGSGFGQIARVWGNLNGSRGASRAKTLHHFAGRALPVEFTGPARTRTLSVTGRLFAPWLPPDETSPWDDFVHLADAPAPVCVRDPEGARFFVSVGDVSLSGYYQVDRNVTVPMTEIDWVEDVQP